MFPSVMSSSAQPSKTTSHTASIIALYNITFDILGIDPLHFDSPALDALLNVLFSQHCMHGVECVTIMSKYGTFITKYDLNEAAARVRNHLQERVPLMFDVGTSFVIQMRSVLKLAGVREVPGLVAEQQRSINETISAPFACSSFKHEAVDLGSIFLGDTADCQFLDLVFSPIFKIYEVNTAAPSVIPTHPLPVEVAPQQLHMFVYIVVPSVLLTCVAAALVVHCVKRRQRLAAIVYAQRREQYSATSTGPSSKALVYNCSGEQQRSSSKVRPGACGYDIEHFGVLQ